MMITAFMLLFSQFLFKTFNIGFVVNIIFALTIFILIYINKGKNSLEEFKKNYFTGGLYAYLTIYVLIYVYDFNRSFTCWDEFSHWGVMIKEMLRLDSLYSVSTSTLLVHQDYPPMIQLFELFWVKLLGAYSESNLITSLHIFELSLFIPSLCDKEDNKIKNIFTSILTFGIVFCIIIFFDQHGVVNSIYIDYVMAILVAYILFIIISEKDTLSNFSLFSLSISMTFLLLIKQMGLPLYLMILFMFIVDLILKKHNNKIKINFNKKNIIKIFKTLILIIIIPLLLFKGWNNYVDRLNISRQFNLSDIRISQLPLIIDGKTGEQYQINAANNFMKAVITKNITTSFVHLSYFMVLILSIFILYIIWKLNKKYFYKNQILLLAVTLILGALGYAFVMLNLYVFAFGPYEGPNLASFNRYMDTYAIILFSILFMIYLYLHKSNKKLLILLIILLILTIPMRLYHLYKDLTKSNINTYEISANNIVNKVGNTSKIYIISQNSDGRYQYYIKYYANPIITNLVNFNLPKGSSSIEYFSDNVNDYMLEYDYLYLAVIDDDFIKDYSFLFPSNDIRENQIYKIINNNGTVKLELVN